MERMAALAWEKYRHGDAIGNVCADAYNELKLRTRKPSDDVETCYEHIRPKYHEAERHKSNALADERAREQAQHEAQVEANQQAKDRAQREARQFAFNQRIADIKAGRGQIQTMKEAMTIYGAISGQHIIAQPLIHPDNRNYAVEGFLDPMGGMQESRIILRVHSFGALHYAYVEFDSNAIRLPPNTHVGSRIAVVGTYVDNETYNTVMGTQRIMPVFNGFYVQVMD